MACICSFDELTYLEISQFCLDITCLLDDTPQNEKGVWGLLHNTVQQYMLSSSLPELMCFCNIFYSMYVRTYIRSKLYY